MAIPHRHLQDPRALALHRAGRPALSARKRWSREPSACAGAPRASTAAACRVQRGRWGPTMGSKSHLHWRLPAVCLQLREHHREAGHPGQTELRAAEQRARPSQRLAAARCQQIWCSQWTQALQGAGSSSTLTLGSQPGQHRGHCRSASFECPLREQGRLAPEAVQPAQGMLFADHRWHQKVINKERTNRDLWQQRKASCKLLTDRGARHRSKLHFRRGTATAGGRSHREAVEGPSVSHSGMTSSTPPSPRSFSRTWMLWI